MEEKRKRRIVFTALFAIALLITAYYQNLYEKYDASWGGVSIYAYAILIGPLIAYLLNIAMKMVASKYGSSRLRREGFSPGPWLYAVMMAACLLSTYLGITLTEPGEDWTSENAQISHNDRYQYSNFARWYYYEASNVQYDAPAQTSSNSDSDSDSDSDGAGEAIIAVIIIAILLSLLILSATVQHFWVVASIAILIMMAQFLYREWKYG